jgi:pimeloyl-ACP methyl ester carboxylesterase
MTRPDRALLLVVLSACSAELPAAPSFDARPAAPESSRDAAAALPDAAALLDAAPPDATSPLDAVPPLDTAPSPDAGALLLDATPPPDARVSCGPAPLPHRAPELVLSDAPTRLVVPRCMDAVMTAVVSAGARWRVELADAPPDARLRVYPPRVLDSLADPLDWPAPLAEAEAVAGSTSQVVQVAPPSSGEVVLVLSREDRALPLDLPLRVTCEAGCDLRATRFPLVLVHGYFGTDQFFGLLDYFHDVPERLRSAGYDVTTPVTDAFNWSEARAAQLAVQVDAVLARTGARKVNLLGHSQGGMDARVLVSGLGYADRVASVTTVATPHLGTPLLVDDLASVQDFGVEYMTQTFNPAYPDAPGVPYFSWSARSCGALDFDCQRAQGGEVVDALLTVFHASLSLRVGDNDGFVPTASMVWGEHLGVLPADHLDEIGQIADPAFVGDPFDHRAFYRSEAERLAAAGL